MEEIKLDLDKTGFGKFYILEDGEEVAEMEVTVSDDRITVHHTEVVPKGEGKGLAKKLLETMVDYARKNALQVVPLCAYVALQFRRHPDEYADVWQKK
jgi:predicted GNAT family acetyltransferase